MSTTDYIAHCDECGREQILHRSGGDHLCDDCCVGGYEWEDDDDTPREGETRIYLSRRSVRGYPYLAESTLRAYRTRDGRLVWRPEGPRHTLGPRGVPSSWYRMGTAREKAASAYYADAPRPWDVIR